MQIANRDKQNNNIWNYYENDLSVKLIRSILKNYLIEKYGLSSAKNYTILNLGSNNKKMSETISAELPAATVYDLDQASLKKELLSSHFVQGDIQKLPYKDRSADLIFCTYVLFYVENKNKAVREIKRILKTGGKAVFLLHSPYSTITHDALNISLPNLINLNNSIGKYIEALQANGIENIAEVIKLQCQKSLQAKVENLADLKELYEKNAANINIFEYFINYAHKKMFKTLTEINNFFKKHGFKNIEIKLAKLNDTKLAFSTSNPKFIEHDGWLVIVKK